MHPPEIAALDVATGAIERLRREARPGLGTPPHATIEKLRAFDGRSIPVNVYLPDGMTGRLPMLVLVHGGPSGNAKVVPLRRGAHGARAGSALTTSCDGTPTTGANGCRA